MNERPVSVYQMAINNTATFIRSESNRLPDDEFVVNAFTASIVLAAAFCKIREEVLNDLLLAGRPVSKF